RGVVGPWGRGAGPGRLEAGGDGVGPLAGAEAVGPAQALHLQVGGFGIRADVVRRAGAVGLAQRVATGDQGDGLLVVHAHAAEGLADVVRGQQRVGIAVGAFRVHVDQAHLDRGQRILEVAAVDLAVGVVLGHQHAVVLRLGNALGSARIALVAAEPGGLAAPVHVLVGLPGVLAAGAE